MSKNKIRECRNCNRTYRTTAGDHKLDGCCSKKCFETKGPYPVIQVQPIPIQIIPEGVKGTKRDKSQMSKVRTHGFYKDLVWIQLRRDVLHKYGRECMLCGQTKGAMHVDHVIPKSKDKSKALDFDNLQVLCAKCNEGKSNRDSADYRPGTTWHTQKVLMKKLKKCQVFFSFGPKGDVISLDKS